MQAIQWLRPKALKLVTILAAFVLASCDENGAQTTGKSERPPPGVVVVPVQTKDVSSAIEYVGRTNASQRVDIRARVSGTLVERPFEEGEAVEQGAMLFKIDPSELEASKAAAEAEVAKAEAVLKEAAASLARYQQLEAKDVASVANLDQAVAKEGQARANLKAAQAALKKAELDLGYAQIVSPLAGRSGIANADVGNLIGPDTGVLVTIVKLDPIHILFSIGEREYLNYRKARAAGNTEEMTPRIKLANGELYKEAGTFDLADNEVDPATGTLKLRVSFPNPDRLIVPGQFVNVVLTSTTPERLTVVPQASVQENQSGPFVLVVGQDNKVDARQIRTGQRVGSEIVALEGVTEGETVIVEGIQKVRPGAVVTPSQRPSAAQSQ